MQLAFLEGSSKKILNGFWESKNDLLRMLAFFQAGLLCTPTHEQCVQSQPIYFALPLFTLVRQGVSAKYNHLKKKNGRNKRSSSTTITLPCPEHYSLMNFRRSCSLFFWNSTYMTNPICAKPLKVSSTECAPVVLGAICLPLSANSKLFINALTVGQNRKLFRKSSKDYPLMPTRNYS